MIEINLNLFVECIFEVELINQIRYALKLLKSIIICDLFSPVNIEII